MKIFYLSVFLFILTTSVDYDWTTVQDQINYYIANGAFAGGILRVSTGNTTLYNNPFGTFTHNILPYSSSPFTNNTIFDLASLTKVSATLSCIMHLYDEGRLDIMDKVTKYIP
jgi:hypothetical protein